MNVYIIEYLRSVDPVLAALYATVFTWLVTALGASVVFFFKGINKIFLDGMLGFTGGVMLAASIWSLLIPAIDMTVYEGFMKLIPAIIGFLFGFLFLFVLDKLLAPFYATSQQIEQDKPPIQKVTLLILAITLHNIPEGLAIGVLFGGVAVGIPEASIAGAVTLAIGLGLQNFPEGIAVSVPLRRIGFTRKKSFFYGQLSAVVEPIAGVFGALAVFFFNSILPYALAFAAGAMIYVVIEEIIPESRQNKNIHVSTFGFLIGFLVMMSLDVFFGS